MYTILVQHLFCRKGADVFGTPLIWLNEATPLVYLFGFFAEICVPLYSLTIGYAQEMLYESGKATWKDRAKRILKLMTNYWIVVVLFSIIGLAIGDKNMPGSIVSFLKSLVLLHSYNGAWWFLHSYVFLLFLPPVFSLFPVHKVPNPIWGGGLCAVMEVGWYLAERFAMLPEVSAVKPIIAYFSTELKNLIGILPLIWFGGIIRRFDLFDKIKTWLDRKIPDEKNQKRVLTILFLVIFVAFNLTKKSVLVSIIDVVVFVVFNLWNKSEGVCHIFEFLGKHSTNIWLTHMFFYLYVFPGLVQKARYPILMLTFILALCITTSYAIILIQKVLVTIQHPILSPSSKRRKNRINPVEVLRADDV